MKIREPDLVSNVSLIGFDSAWTDNPKQPGAICSLDIDNEGRQSFFSPRLVSFDQARNFILEKANERKKCVIAIDQPTIVKNLGGMRAVERVAATAISFAGGGVQPANLSKEKMFGPNAPIWKFKNDISANDDPRLVGDRSHITLVEVYPALALLGLEPTFFQRNGCPKYNPKNKRKFRRRDWEKIIDILVKDASRKLDEGCAIWLTRQKLLEPVKSDQDLLDSYICLSILIAWLFDSDSNTKMIGDVHSGYILSPLSEAMLDRMAQKATQFGVPIC